MKKYWLLLICFVAIQWTYAQSTITINSGSSISVGAGCAVNSGYRDGTLTNAGTFNSRSITFDPVATAASSITQTSFSANWNASSGATGYKLDVSTDLNFGTFVTGFQNLDVGSVTTFSVSSNLSAGSTYYYRLRAYDIDGITGYSNTITVVMAPVNPVATVATNMTDISFSANWNITTGATGYRLDVSIDAAFTTFVAGFENKDVANVTTYSVTGLSGNTAYYYRIRAYNVNGTSGNSNSITVLTAPAAPNATAAAAIEQTSFSANWNPSAGATGYRLDVSTAVGFGAGTFVTGYQNLDVSNVTTFSVNTNLTAGTTYHYRVRAYNGSCTSGNSSTIDLITIPPNPTATAASNILSISFDANWNTSTGAAKYYLDVSTDAAFGAGNFVTDYEDKDVGSVTTFSVNTNLLSGTTYYYRVRANDAGGTSGNSAAITVLTIPAAPNATAATSLAQTSFIANWDATVGVAKYYLDVATNNTFTNLVTNWNNKDVGSVITYSVNTNLNAGTTYYYRVRANNATGTGNYSNTITLVTIPPDPTVNAATNITQSSFNANWNTSATATGYRLDVSTDPSFVAGTFAAGFQDLDVLNVTTYSVSGLTANTTYYYRVRAYNESGTSGNSGIISQLTAPLVPTETAATLITQTSFSANWNPSAGAAGYRLDVATDNGFGAGTFVTGYQDKDVNNVTTFSVNTYLTEGTSYYYRIRSYNAGGTSTSSGTISLATVPAAPLETSASLITATSFSANWNLSTGATGYRLDVSTDIAFGAGNFVIGYQNKDVGNVSTSTVNTNLVEGTTYYYRIRAYNSGGTSGNSGVITVLTLSTAPTANAATSVNGIKFTANWSSVTGASGYVLDVSIDAGYASFVSGYNNFDVGNVTSIVVSGLSKGITYYYRVRAYSVGGQSGNSNSISVKTLSPSPVVTNATPIAATSFSANWNAATGATGYFLDAATDAAITSFVAGFNNKDVGNVITYSVTGLTAGDTYYYRLRAYNASGTGENSNTITVMTVPPAPVELAASSIAHNSFDANWNASNGATGYYLDVATDNLFSSFVAGFNNKNIGNVTTYSVTGLSESTGYYYRIRAYNTGGTSVNSGTENPTTLANLVSVPSVNPATAITATSFSANWNAVAGVTKYYLDVSTVSNFASFVTDWENVDVGNVITYSVNTNLSAGNIYYYRVRAFNASGTSGNSNVVMVRTIPLPPVEKAASSITATDFVANWNASTGATGYYLDVATDNGFTTFVSGFNNRDVGNVLTYSVTGLTGSTSYYYRIRAYNTGGISGNSGTINPTTLAGGTVIATAATSITSTTFNANWNAYGGATGYRLDVSTDPAFGLGNFVPGFDNQNVNNVVTITVNGLSAGTNYYYRVKAYDGGGTIGTSGTINVITLPDAPTSTAATSIAEISFDANWNAAISATGYYLDVATDNGFTSFVTGFNNKYVNNVTTYSITGLTGGTNYYYRVRAKNGSGISISSSVITVLTTPHEPTSTYATALANTSISANWDASASATGYRLDVSAVSNFASFVGIYNNLDVGNVNTKSVTGLAGGTTYYYRVRAYNGSGASNNSETITVLTLPSAPNSTAGTSVSKTSFTSNWDASVGATKYYLDVATTSNFSGGTYVDGYQNLDVNSALSYSVSGLTSGSTYYYRVRAFNPSGTSSSSSNQSVLTFPPTPIISSATSIQSTSFDANWNASTSATGYRLDVSTVSNFASFVGIYNNLDVGNVTTRSVSGLSSGTTYYFRVRAYNGSGTSDDSGTMSVLIAPTAPVATAASSITGTSFYANWNSSAGTDGYKIDVSTDAGFSTFVAGYNNRDVGSATSFAITGLTSGTTFYYQIRSYSGSRTSGNSNSITVLTKPADPTATAASSIAETSFSANWNSSTGAAKYYLDVATDNGFTNIVAGFNNKDAGNSTTCSVTGLSANTIYYYRVRSDNASGTSGNSGTINILTSPSSPISTAATSITNANFQANWNSSVGATGYRLDVSTVSNFLSFVGVYNNLNVGNVNTYSVAGLNGNTNYYYRIRAYNGSGTSGNSGTINLTTAVDPSGVPTATAATNLAQTSFSANWNPVAGAAGYKLDVSTDWNFGTGTFVTNFSDRDVSNVTTFSVTGLTGGTTYFYRLRSYNASGTSGNSGSITVLTVPSAPLETSASLLTSTSLSANWNSSVGATGYYLDVATDNGFTSFVVLYNNKDVSNVTTYSVSGLLGGTNYYYRVRAYNGSGTSLNSGTITSLTLPSAPTANAASVLAETSFSANWNSVTGASGYRLDVSTDSGFGAGTFVTNYQDKDVSGVTTYSVTGLTGGTAYYYRVRAYNGSGTSSNSNSTTVLTIPIVPTATAGTSIVETSFSANWNSVTGATKYYLDVSTSSGFGAGTFLAGYQNKDVSNVTTYSITTLSANTNYYYRVRSYNSSGASGNSNTITIMTSPLPPITLDATSSAESSFNANWNSSVGATGYKLDVSTDVGFGAGAFESDYEDKDVGNVTTFSVTGITSGITHYYRLRAYNGGGSSSSSGSIKVLGVPTANNATAIAITSFTANWDAVPGVIGYRLDVSTDIGFAAGSFVGGYQNKDVGNVTTFPVSGLAPNTGYFYRVRSYDVSETSGNSNIIIVKNVPNAPVALNATKITQTSFIANWNLSAGGATGYCIDVAFDAGFTTFETQYQNKVVYNVTTFTVSNISPGTTYYYRVRAYNSWCSSDNSNVITVHTLNNSAPFLNGVEVTALNFTEGSSPLQITSGITISDIDSPNLETAVIQISNNYKNGEDVLNFTNQNGITCWWNPADGSLNLTGTASLSNYQNALQSVKYSNSSSNPSSAVRTISFTVSDGIDNSNTVVRNIAVISVNSSPILSDIENEKLKYIEGEGLKKITASINITDIDNVNLEKAVVSISNNFKKDQDELVFTNEDGVSGIWDSQNGTLTLSGTSTLLNYQNALRNVNYSNSSNRPDSSHRTITFMVNDGNTNSNILSRDLWVQPVNTPPQLSMIETDPILYKIKQCCYEISNSILITDPDNDYGEGAIITISGNYKSDEDKLVFDGAEGITGNWNANNGSMVLTGHSLVRNYQAAFRNMHYLNICAIPKTVQRSISIVYNDGSDQSNIVFRNVEIASGNIAPIISQIEQSKLNYLRIIPPLIISDSLVISDCDDLNLQSAEVKIEEGFIPGEDILDFNSSQIINGLYNPSTGILSFTGQSDIKSYENILRSVKYKNAKGTGSTQSTKKIVFSAKDGIDKSNSAVRFIFVEGIITDVREINNEIPTSFALFQNYPNPFNPTSVIRFAVPKQSKVLITIYDPLGREIQKLVDEEKSPGYYEVTFKAGSIRGGLTSGLYIYTFRAGDYFQSKKMLLIK